MSPQPCYCINPDCQRPNDPSSITDNFCISCGSSLILNGKYRVKQLLSNNSGFGIIYEAESTQRKILKVLKPEHNNSPKVIELFKQEYDVLYNLTKQGIKSIPQVESNDYFQYQTATGLILHCIIMEKVEGINLEQWVYNNGQISEKQAFKWLKEITQILAKVHQQNYFHRDIKPQNIMQRNSGELVLIDFGTAREQTHKYYSQLQKHNITEINSPGYTPDEQQNGQAVIQSDFFALGRTFVHLLTGRHPSDMYDGYSNVLNWRGYTTNINPLLLEFVDELMAVSANRRPANTGVILQRLNQIETAINQTQIPQPQSQIPQPQTQISQSQSPPQSLNIFLTIITSLSIVLGYFVIKEFNQNKTPVVQQTPNNQPTPTVQPTPNNQPTPVVQQTPINQNLTQSQRTISNNNQPSIVERPSRGMWVTKVNYNSQAYLGGIRTGQFLVSLNNVYIDRVEIANQIVGANVGREIIALVWDNGQEIQLTITPTSPLMGVVLCRQDRCINGRSSD